MQKELDKIKTGDSKLRREMAEAQQQAAEALAKREVALTEVVKVKEAAAQGEYACLDPSLSYNFTALTGAALLSVLAAPAGLLMPPAHHPPPPAPRRTPFRSDRGYGEADDGARGASGAG